MFKINLESSFEGEYRCVLSSDKSIYAIVTMPWAKSESIAVKQFGLFLTRASTDVLYALKNDAPCTIDFIQRILKRPF